MTVKSLIVRYAKSPLKQIGSYSEVPRDSVISHGCVGQRTGTEMVWPKMRGANFSRRLGHMRSVAYQALKIIPNLTRLCSVITSSVWWIFIAITSVPTGHCDAFLQIDRVYCIHEEKVEFCSS